jgi:XTP/dITP diphosphohydrolase
MITLVFATNNLHKLEEIQSKVAESFILKSLTDINCSDDIEETGITLEENATIKSTYIHQKFNVNCFADDTGLEVEALNNEPGVYSARYSGDRDFKKNMDLLLKNLNGQPNRNAQFRTVISLILEGKEYLFEGFIKGKIREQPTGNEGFGYDPIFEPAGFSKTFAEMGLAEKNQISHRALATEKLISFLINYNKS